MTTRREFFTRAALAGIGAAASTGIDAAAQRRTRSTAPTAGTVQTVRGPIDASRLGFTLPHEHLYASSAGFWQAWPQYFGGRASFMAKIVDALAAARDEGVRTLVDLTPLDVGRDVRFMEEVSRRSGMQIVACTGHWLNPSLSMSARTVEELTDFFIMEIERGMEGTDIKAGVIKVATSAEGITPFAEKTLRAAARASKATGAPVSTHSHAGSRNGEKQAEIFEAEGLDPAAVCIGHSDDTEDMEYLFGLARRGYTLGMDHGIYGIPEPGQPQERAPVHWHRRAECIGKLVEADLASKVFLSNDWFFGISIAATGTMEAFEKRNPDGLLFVTRKVIPYLRQIGVAEQAIRTITVENPKRFFGRA